ncbi:MAG: outer membrane beta-barrel protein [Bacteroidales bacterium]
MKSFLLFGVLLAQVAILPAQESRVRIGLEAVALRTMPFAKDLPEGISPLLVVAPGYRVEYALTPILSLKGGLAYERKGFSGNLVYTDIYGVPVDSVELRTRWDCLVLPLSISASSSGPVRVHADLGVLPGILVRATNEIPTTDLRVESVDTREASAPFSFGLTFSGGVSLPLGDGLALDLSIQDHLGLTGVYRSESSWRMRFHSLGMGASLLLSL